MSKCPICRRELSGMAELAALVPFCSARCKDRDLLNWLGEGYALPVSPHEDWDDQPED